MFYKPVEKATKGGQIEHGAREVVRGRENAKEIFDAFHDSLMGGHTGTTKTCTAISQRYFWPKLWDDVKAWV